jgi:hypothetical protein
MVVAMSRKLLPTTFQGRVAIFAGIILLFAAGFLAISRFLGGPVAIRTGTVGCYLSNIEGELVTDPVDGVAIIEPGGHRRSVIWSRTWSGRQSGSEVEVLNSQGKVAYRTGSYVHLSGADDPDNSDGWLACSLEAIGP